MKFKVLFIVLFLIIFKAANAQKGFRASIYVMPGLSFGAKWEGFADTSFSKPDSISLRKKATFIIDLGAELSYFFSEETGISIGVIDAHQGQNYSLNNSTSGNSSFTLEESVSLHYLRIPVQFHFVTFNPLGTSISLSAGIYFGSLLKYKYESDLNLGDSIILTSEATSNILTETISGVVGNYTLISYISNGLPFEKHDVGATISIGSEYRISSKIKVPVLLNYQHGFTDILNHNAMLNSNNGGSSALYWKGKNFSTYHNHALTLKVGFVFKF